MFYGKGIFKEVNPICTKQYFLCCVAKSEGGEIIIGTVYCRPALENDCLIKCLPNDLVEIEYRHSTKDIIVGGDFNSRIGKIGNLEEEVLENTTFYGQKLSLDKFVNKRVENLVQMMSERGMLVCNGRSSDSPAIPTYIGPKGFSVIDHVSMSFPSTDLI